MMEVWVLIFVLASGHTFDGGAYYDEGRCEIGRALQTPHWRKVYGQDVFGFCKATVQRAGGMS